MDDKLIEKFDATTGEKELVELFEAYLKESQPYHDELLKSQKTSREYYIGNQTERDLIPNHNTNTVENRIFEAIETLVPIATSRPHQFIVLPGSDNETSVVRANTHQKVLARKYETLEMQRKLEEIARHMLLNRFGVAKWCWSYEKDDIDVEVKDPKLILIPKLRMDPHDLPYKIEIQEYTRGEMEEYWPKVKLDDFSPEQNIDTGKDTDTGQKKPYRVYELWTPEAVAWICSKKLLEVRENPYWDFKGRGKKYLEVKTDKKGKKKAKIKEELVYDNVFDRPTDPYVFFTTFRTGEEPVGSVSLVEILIPIQDAINRQKRGIIDNLRTMGNGQVLMDEDAMSQERRDNITNEPGLIISGDGLVSGSKYRRDPGVALPNAHFSNLQHSESIFDNIAGVHGATRGQTGGKTLGQDLLSRQQDYTRVDLITRVLNRGVARLAMGLTQLMKMYYTEVHVTKILGEEGAVEFVRHNRDDIEKHIEIIVKSGESLPMDKVSLRSEAVQLWQLGALDPTTLFERLEFPDAAKSSDRLLKWKQGMLNAETQAKIAQMAAQSKFGTDAKLAEASAEVPEGADTKVETPANVMQRAIAGMGGTAPSLPDAPKLAGQ